MEADHTTAKNEQLSLPPGIVEIEELAQLRAVIEIWMDRAAELREQAVRVAQLAAARDLERCQLALIDLAGTCTRCHQSFRVPVQIRAFAAKD